MLAKVEAAAVHTFPSMELLSTEEDVLLAKSHPGTRQHLEQPRTLPDEQPSLHVCVWENLMCSLAWSYTESMGRGLTSSWLPRVWVMKKGMGCRDTRQQKPQM